MKLKCCFGTAWLGLLLAGTSGLTAATYFVGVTDSGFSPNDLTIAQGDEVVWINQDGEFHSITSNLGLFDPNYWSALLFDEDETFSRVFPTVGTFGYSDSFTGRTGVIRVTPGSAPEINLTTPRLEDGALLFDVAGLTPGRFVVLERSTNLTAWTGVSTNFIVTVPVTLANPISSGPEFFRVYETSAP